MADGVIDRPGRGDEERLRLALEAGRMGTWEWHIPSGAISWSEQLEPIHGLAPGTFNGDFEAFLEIIHPEDRDQVVTKIQEAVDSLGEYEVEFRVTWPDGSIHWVGGRGRVFTDAAGDPEIMIGIGMDITEQKTLLERERAALERSEIARERLEFLAEASKLVAASLNYKKTLDRITRLAVPRLADWCGIDMLRADGTSEWVSGVHIDPSKEDLIRVLRAKYPLDVTSPQMQELLTTMRGQVYSEISDELLRESARDDEHYRLLRELGFNSIMIVPLTARGRVIGLFSLLTSEDSGRRYTEDDLSLATEIARRCAIAVENARLYEERSYIARTLQRALLPPELPDVPGLDVAARFLPAGEGNDVGGDFYDLFATGSGHWGLAIGDVCGKGASAATLTGIARHTIRAASLQDSDPAHVMEILNEAITRQSSDSEFVTAIYGDIEMVKDAARISFCIAGHPEPVLIRADGTAELVGAEGDLLGVLPDAETTATELDLAPGDSLLLYTDGVIEVRDGERILGRSRFVEALRDLGPDRLSSASAIADAVEGIVDDFGESPRDDIALLVLRVTA